MSPAPAPGHRKTPEIPGCPRQQRAPDRKNNARPGRPRPRPHAPPAPRPRVATVPGRPGLPRCRRAGILRQSPAAPDGRRIVIPGPNQHGGGAERRNAGAAIPARVPTARLFLVYHPGPTSADDGGKAPLPPSYSFRGSRTFHPRLQHLSTSQLRSPYRPQVFPAPSGRTNHKTWGKYYHCSPRKIFQIKTPLGIFNPEAGQVFTHLSPQGYQGMTRPHGVDKNLNQPCRIDLHILPLKHMTLRTYPLERKRRILSLLTQRNSGSAYS